MYYSFFFTRFAMSYHSKYLREETLKSSVVALRKFAVWHYIMASSDFDSSDSDSDIFPLSIVRRILHRNGKLADKPNTVSSITNADLFSDNDDTDSDDIGYNEPSDHNETSESDSESNGENVNVAKKSDISIFIKYAIDVEFTIWSTCTQDICHFEANENSFQNKILSTKYYWI